MATDRFQTFEDYFNSLPELGATGQGWPIQLWKKKNNGELSALTLHSNHLGLNGYVNGPGIAKLAYDFLPEGIPVIISKFFFASSDINPGLSKVYWYLEGYDGTDTEKNPFELRRGQVYYMFHEYAAGGEYGLMPYKIWRVIQPTQYPGYLNNLNNFNNAASGYDIDHLENWQEVNIENGKPGTDSILANLETNSIIKWLAIILAIAIALMVLAKALF